MNELFAQFWWVFVIALLVGIIVSWWLFAANRKTTIAREPAADDAAKGAKRNQALIDSAPAASPAPPVPAPEGLAGIGTVVGHEAAHTPSPAPAGGGDDLTRLKGVGPKLAARLHELGITQLSQIAAWGEADIDQFDSHLGDFAGRIRRDNWVEQANLLASGDEAAFKEKFGAM